MILWIENYSNKADNAGFEFESIDQAIEFSKLDYHYGINNACGINTISGKRYRFTIKDDAGKIIKTKRDILKLVNT